MKAIGLAERASAVVVAVVLAVGALTAGAAATATAVGTGSAGARVLADSCPPGGICTKDSSWGG